MEELKIKLEYIVTLRANKKLHEAIKSAKELHLIFPLSFRPLLQLSQCYLEDKQIDKAVTTLHKAQKLGLPIEPYLRTKMWIGWYQNEREFIQYAEELQKINAKIAPTTLEKLAEAYYSTDQKELAILTLDKAILGKKRNRSNTVTLGSDTLNSKGICNKQDKTTTEKDQLEYISKISSAIPDSPTGRRKALIKAVMHQITTTALQRPIIIDNPNSELQISPLGNTGKVAIVFTGLADRLMSPIAIMDTYMASCGITAIYVRDFNRLLYAKGIEPIAKNYSETLLGLTKLISTLDSTSEIFTIGTSGGGLGALNYGISLEANRILCFSTPTNLTKDFMAKINDTRGRFFIDRISKYVPVQYLDIPRQLLLNKSTSQILLVYGEDNESDRAHAEQLIQNPKSTLYPLPKVSEHNSLHHIILNNKLSELLLGFKK